MLDWHTDQHGMVIGARIHDGYLRGLSYIDGGCLKLYVQRIAGDSVELRLTDVGFVGISGTLTGAIVGSLYSWSVSQAAKLELTPGGPWNTLLGYSPRPEEIERIVENTLRKRPAAQLVHLDSSYGPTISAVCSGMTIEDIEELPSEFRRA